VRLFHSQLLAGFDRRTFRFTIRDLLLVTLIVALIAGWWFDHRRLMFELRGYGGPLSAGGGYEKCTTLADAVKLAQGQLAQDGKREFAALLTEEKVRSAIIASIKRTDAHCKKYEEGVAFNDYWRSVVKPKCLEIVDTDRWPGDCSLDGSYGVIDTNGISYEGLELRLNIKTPSSSKYPGFYLPVLDLFFGMGRD